MSNGYQVHRCADCGLIFHNPQPSDEVLKEIYNKDYFLGEDSDESRDSVAEMKTATARLYVDALVAYHGSAQGKLLEIGCGRGEFLKVAQERGYKVAGNDVNPSVCEEANRRLKGEFVRCGSLDSLGLEPASFDICVMFDVIEHARNPVHLLEKVRSLLKIGGTLFVVTPSLDSFSAKLLKQNWMEFKPEHLFYFDSQTIQHALAKSGFSQLEFGRNFKVLTFDYLHRHFERFRVPLLTRAMAFLHLIFPKAIQTHPMKLSSSGMNVLCRRVETRKLPLLSILVPVYNEASTFPILMESLLKKELLGVDKEIIIVESNSSDGTRNEVMKFEGRPGIKILLEDRPQGKGHAVRTGLMQASGDIVIIQDGDLEYDINDYDQLLEPLLRYQSAVVLGSRHSGSWKIRDFRNQPLITFILNSAHLFFAFLINVSCGSKLRDPFTMYKVFRRDCVYGLSFKANRFDFDWELMIKLLRKGYKPLEIPVNYFSRSFKEGKKVRIFWDPLTWIWALIRFRTCKLYERKILP